MFFKPQHVHFVGIGGIGMSGIAEVLLTLGYQVSGSDIRQSAITDRLVKLGASIQIGHRAVNVEGAKAVVVTSALDAANPEVGEARRLQVPVIPRGEMLAELMRLKYGIAIAGSHGKTTTTSMVASILNTANLDPTVVVGGKVAAMQGSNARVGKSALLVVESDESDGSFLKLAPILAVVTNIDREHLDHYASLDEIKAAFTEFVNRVPFYGAAVLCIEDKNIQQIFPSVRRRTVTYGRSAQADLDIQNVSLSSGSSEFMVRRCGSELGPFRLNVPGVHNVLNATAAIAVALELDVSVKQIVEGLDAFSGVDRRFSIRGREREVTVVDDYGHHPTEIKATLSAARIGAPNRRIVVLFQPHRYSRTADLMDEFASAFNNADVLLVTEIYAASETPIDGITGEALTGRITSYGHKNAEYVGAVEEAAELLRGTVREGDLVITLGAGSVTRTGDQLLALLRTASAVQP